MVSHIFLVWDIFAIDPFSGFLVIVHLTQFSFVSFWWWWILTFQQYSWSLFDTCFLLTLLNENRLPYHLALTLCQLTFFLGRSFLNKRLFSKRCLIGSRIWQQNVLLPLGATVFNYPLHLYFPYLPTIGCWLHAHGLIVSCS